MARTSGGTPDTVVKKGIAGGDIQSVISFDGRWMAFSRSMGGQRVSARGEDDWYVFLKWEVYIARLDVDFPTTPIKIGQGYYPVWADDSHSAIKTLYYMTYHKGRIVRKVKIDDNGIIPGSDQIKWQIPLIIGNTVYTGHAQISPNGKFIAWRNGRIFLYFFEEWMGQKAGTNLKTDYGYMPSITPDSRWVLFANRMVARVGKPAIKFKGGGAHPNGISQDMNWLICKTKGSLRNQNQGSAVDIYPIKIKGKDAKEYFDDSSDLESSDFELLDGLSMTKTGSWPDIHVGPQKSDPTILFNRLDKSAGDAFVRIFGLDGRNKAAIRSSGFTQAVNSGHLGTGVYIMITSNPDKKIIQKRLLVK